MFPLETGPVESAEAVDEEEEEEEEDDEVDPGKTYVAAYDRYLITPNFRSENEKIGCVGRPRAEFGHGGRTLLVRKATPEYPWAKAM